MAWLRFPSRRAHPRDHHVVPEHDVKEHQVLRTCWCRPHVEVQPHTTVAVVVHNSLDGREFSEPDYDPKYYPADA